MNACYCRKFELDAAVFAKTNSLFTKALKGGRHLTRTQLAAILHSAGITASGLQLGYILMRAELDAVICSGAMAGKQQTYALFDERVPRVKAVARDDALAELTRRYFTSRGPATLKDYVRWSSLTAADGRRGLEMVKSSLEHELIGGRTYWFAPSSPGPKPASPVIDLVQGYDEYVMSYSESKDVLYPSTRVSAVPQGQPVFMHAILLDGQLIGHWKHVLNKNMVTIETHLYEPLRGTQAQALQAAAECYGRFLGVPVFVRPN